MAGCRAKKKALHSFRDFKNKQKLCSFDFENLRPFEFITHWLELAVSLHLAPPIHNDTKPWVFTVLQLNYLRGGSTFKNFNPEALVSVGLPE